MAARKVDNKAYRAKPGYKAKKKILNKHSNRTTSVKATKKAYDQSDRAKRMRVARLRERAQQLLMVANRS